VGYCVESRIESLSFRASVARALDFLSFPSLAAGLAAR
jgi:hypothetical protein